MARHSKHWERVAGIRKMAGELSPERFPTRIANLLEHADEMEARFREMGLWNKPCGQFCPCMGASLERKE